MLLHQRLGVVGYVLHGGEVHQLSDVEGAAPALERLESGSYGICAGCGEAIPTARLEALPTATRCVACAAG